MKWHGLPQSDYVEVDCLGKRVNLKSPEGEAALACQNEVDQLRQNFVQKAKSPDAAADFDNAYMAFGNQVDKGQVKKLENNGILSFFSAFTTSEKTEDTYGKRVESFSKFLDLSANPVTEKSAKNKP